MRTPDQEARLLILENLSIGYERRFPLVEGISQEVRAGEMVALIGRNGTGKSTLIRTAAGIIPALRGQCTLEGEPVRSMDLRKRARKVSFVASQVSQLPPVTVRELVSLGRMPHTGWRGTLGQLDREMVQEAIRMVRLEELIDRTLDHLSDGERQRAMIARAFVQDTPLMLLDEPTAFLDLPNRYELIQLLTGFREAGKAILYSTHDFDLAMMSADRLWVLHQGNMVEGIPEDLGIRGVYESLFESTTIRFDVEMRKFRPAVTLRGTLQLSCEDQRLLAWTRNAIERIGYQVDNKAEKKLKVTASNGNHTWILTWEDGSIQFENIESLARFLTKEN